MRRTERPFIGKRAAREIPGDGVDERNLEQFARAERRQDRGQPRGEHRFSRSRGSVQQKIVPPGGGDFERALGAFLSLDVAKVRLRSHLSPHGRPRRRHDLGALEMIGELDQRKRCQHIDVLCRPGCLWSARVRADEPVATRIRGNRGGEHASDRGDRSIEREFAENGVI